MGLAKKGREDTSPEVRAAALLLLRNPALTDETRNLLARDIGLSPAEVRVGRVSAALQAASLQTGLFGTRHREQGAE